MLTITCPIYYTIQSILQKVKDAKEEMKVFRAREMDKNLAKSVNVIKTWLHLRY